MTTPPGRWSAALAFFLALIAPPLLFAALGYAINPNADIKQGHAREILGMTLLLSAAAGGPSYLLVGAPMLWRAARRGERQPLRFALQGLMANFIAAPIAALLLAGYAVYDMGRLEKAYEGAVLALLIHGMGVVFAPLYGGVFGLVYRRLAPPPVLRPAMSEKRALEAFE